MTDILAAYSTLEERDKGWYVLAEGEERRQVVKFLVKTYFYSSSTAELNNAKTSYRGWKVSRIVNCWSVYLVKTTSEGSGTDWHYSKREKRIWNCG